MGLLILRLKELRNHRYPGDAYYAMVQVLNAETKPMNSGAPYPHQNQFNHAGPSAMPCAMPCHPQEWNGPCHPREWNGPQCGPQQWNSQQQWNEPQWNIP